MLDVRAHISSLPTLLACQVLRQTPTLVSVADISIAVESLELAVSLSSGEILVFWYSGAVVFSPNRITRPRSFTEGVHKVDDLVDSDILSGVRHFAAV